MAVELFPPVWSARPPLVLTTSCLLYACFHADVQWSVDHLKECLDEPEVTQLGRSARTWMTGNAYTW